MTERSAPVIAIVASDILMRALLIRVLDAAGYVPVVVRSYDELVSLIDASVCVAVVDAPADNLHIESVAPPVPVVVITSTPIHTTSDWWRVVEKPFTRHELLGAIEALLPTDRPHSRLLI